MSTPSRPRRPGSSSGRVDVGVTRGPGSRRHACAYIANTPHHRLHRSCGMPRPGASLHRAIVCQRDHVLDPALTLARWIFLQEILQDARASTRPKSARTRRARGRTEMATATVPLLPNAFRDHRCRCFGRTARSSDGCTSEQRRAVACIPRGPRFHTAACAPCGFQRLRPTWDRSAIQRSLFAR